MESDELNNNDSIESEWEIVPDAKDIPVDATAKSESENEKKRAEHNSRVLNELRPGDLLEFKRKLYSHWAIYIGSAKIIHLYGENESLLNISGCTFEFPVMSHQAQVMISSYWDITKDSLVYRNNSFDDEVNPLAPEEILIRAYNQVGSQSYSIFSYNCEHFAKHCRYGLPNSNQINNLLKLGNNVTKGLRNIHDSCVEFIREQKKSIKN